MRTKSRARVAADRLKGQRPRRSPAPPPNSARWGSIGYTKLLTGYNDQLLHQLRPMMLAGSNIRRANTQNVAATPEEFVARYKAAGGQVIDR